MAMFDSLRKLFSRKKETRMERQKPSMTEYAHSIIEGIESTPEGRRGHGGQFANEVRRRRARNKVARKSRRINRQRGA